MGSISRMSNCNVSSFGSTVSLLRAVCMISSKEKGSPDRNSISGFCLTALAIGWNDGATCEKERSGACEMKEGGKVVCQLEPFVILARGVTYTGPSWLSSCVRPSELSSMRSPPFVSGIVPVAGKGDATRRDSTVYRGRGEGEQKERATSTQSAHCFGYQNDPRDSRRLTVAILIKNSASFEIFCKSSSAPKILFTLATGKDVVPGTLSAGLAGADRGFLGAFLLDVVASSPLAPSCSSWDSGWTSCASGMSAGSASVSTSIGMFVVGGEATVSRCRRE